MGLSCGKNFIAACFSPKRVNIACRGWLLDCKSKNDFLDFVQFAKGMRRFCNKRGYRGQARRFAHWIAVAQRLVEVDKSFARKMARDDMVSKTMLPPQVGRQKPLAAATEEGVSYKITIRGRV